MKIANKNVMILNFITKILSDKNDNYYLVKPELIGKMNISTGTKNKKYQYVSGEICIPHNLLNEEYKKDFDVAYNFDFDIHGFLHKDFVNDEFMKHYNESDEDLNNFFKKNPRVGNALNELIEALKECKGE